MYGELFPMTPTYRPRDWQRLTRDEWSTLYTLVACVLPVGVGLITITMYLAWRFGG